MKKISELVYYYGPMGSSKSAQALIRRYEMEDKGNKVIFAKPSVDTRDENPVVSSRIGISAPCDIIDAPKLENGEVVSGIIENIFEKYNEYIKKEDIKAVIIDEVQFLHPSQIENLRVLVYKHSIPIFVYGLATNFRGELFPASKKLIEIADRLERLEMKCHCGLNATMTARYDETGILRDGPDVLIGGNDSYTSLCPYCHMIGDLGPTINIKKLNRA